MTDKITLTIDLTPEESQRVEGVARAQGYDTPAEYIHALVADAIKTITASELLKLPREERNKILAAMAAEAANDPEYLLTLEEFDVLDEADFYDETP